MQAMYRLHRGAQIKPRLGWQGTTQETISHIVERRGPR